MATVAEFTNRPSQFPIVKVFTEYLLVNVEIEQLKQTQYIHYSLLLAEHAVNSTSGIRFVEL